MEINKGKQYTIGTKFSYKGAPAVFNQPPLWTIYTETDDSLLSQPALQVGNRWNAVFTIPTNYIVPNGKEDLTIQFHGTDSKGRTYVADKLLTIFDNTEFFTPNGVFFNYITDESIEDYLITNSDEADFDIRIFDSFGEQVQHTSLTNQTAVSANSNGYKYDFNLPPLVIDKNVWLDPFNIVYRITTASGTYTETHPLFILDFKVINVVNELQTMLDKSKLIEVDPSLQWHNVELIQAVLAGVKRINASPPEVTLWKLHDFPSGLDRFLTIAAAIYSLESRFLAEGLNAFDFQGLNSQLNYNRTEYLSQLLDRYNAVLDQLPLAKKSAILTNGKGEIAGNEVDKRVRNIGTLGLGVNTLNNRIGYNRFRRFY